MLIDSHCHLDMPLFDADRVETIARAREAGVEVMLEIAGSDVAHGSLDKGLQLADEFSFIYAAIGLHPHEASLYDPALERQLFELSRHPKVIGWGEIGLDYHYDYSPRDVQRNVFRRQLEQAIERRLPVIIHTREAETETIQTLKSEFSSSKKRGVFHCFSGSMALAKEALDLGFFISFSGIVTFKKADDLRAVAEYVPTKQLLIETDCPFLAPVPHRGKRNEPAFVVEVARCIAALKNVAIEELGQITAANFARLFTPPV